MVDRCKKLTSLKISNKTDRRDNINIMTVVIRAKDSLKNLEVDHSMVNWTSAGMAKLGRLQNLQSLTIVMIVLLWDGENKKPEL